MGLRDIYYYFIAFAMIIGVIVAYLLNLDIDPKPNGGFVLSFGLQIVFLSQIENCTLLFGMKNSIINFETF